LLEIDRSHLRIIPLKERMNVSDDFDGSRVVADDRFNRCLDFCEVGFFAVKKRLTACALMRIPPSG
jgi:hypothetical protein